jgi:hypothetical protein
VTTQAQRVLPHGPGAAEATRAATYGKATADKTATLSPGTLRRMVKTLFAHVPAAQYVSKLRIDRHPILSHLHTPRKRDRPENHPIQGRRNSGASGHTPCNEVAREVNNQESDDGKKRPANKRGSSAGVRHACEATGRPKRSDAAQGRQRGQPPTPRLRRTKPRRSRRGRCSASLGVLMISMKSCGYESNGSNCEVGCEPCNRVDAEPQSKR